MTKLIIPFDTAREHPAFIADLEAAGCEIELYDDLDYVSRPELRAALNKSTLADIDPDEFPQTLRSAGWSTCSSPPAPYQPGIPRSPGSSDGLRNSWPRTRTSRRCARSSSG